MNGGARADEAFLGLLKAQTGPALVGPTLPMAKAHPGHAQLSRLQLQETDVAKVGQTACMPLLSKVCLACVARADLRIE